ncbi:hypothetical protein PMNALOAF_2734 [Methylobacterium adhaesivum]|uniref:Winged helix DNA-binding domain-containing protein n=1 Tax=Methylobacterium adhaesivum TaxID=333297 RepID=A0ABT8BLM3_9HYPH|nr:hypothetical protein [Methylobacterium adhaesivum]MDN3592089.1 hypothetical protein [Methylobacterium adhaesivum]GJD31475.1 hypothetical protein PMNALOAF_2734 [Methylobacterium adhaesivum]
MPIMPEVRRLGLRWEALQSAVSSFMASAPTDGVPLWQFEEQCLPWIAPEDRPAIVKALRGKRLIFPVRNGAVVRIFATVPTSRLFEPPADVPLDQFLRAVSPHMHRLAEIVGSREAEPMRANRSVEAEASRLLSAIMQRHFDKGLDLGGARAALWRTFHADVMAVVMRRNPILARESRVSVVAPRKVKPKKVAAGLPLPERIVALVGKAGKAGLVKTDLRRALPRPRPSAADLDETIVSLTESGLLQTATVKLTVRGKPGLRLFSAGADVPRVMSDGTAAFD